MRPRAFGATSVVKQDRVPFPGLHKTRPAVEWQLEVIAGV